MIIDTHLHIIDPSALRYPWLHNAPALQCSFLYSDYAEEAKSAGISAALHMEVDVDEDDIEAETEYVARHAAEPGSLLAGAIAGCRLEDDDFGRYLEQIRTQGIVKGLRRVLHTMPDSRSERPVFGENIRRLEGCGLTFDLCVLPRQFGRAAELADLAPQLQFVLDHCEVPDIKRGDFNQWKAGISELARRPNIVGKLSGLSVYAETESWTEETLRQYVEHMIASFGFDRMVWGSDWPICTLAGSLSNWVAVTHTLLAGSSAEEKAKLLAGNAMRLWKLEGLSASSNSCKSQQMAGRSAWRRGYGS